MHRVSAAGVATLSSVRRRGLSCGRLRRRQSPTSMSEDWASVHEPPCGDADIVQSRAGRVQLLSAGPSFGA
jgi:hypothetical protein